MPIRIDSRKHNSIHAKLIEYTNDIVLLNYPSSSKIINFSIDIRSYGIIIIIFPSSIFFFTSAMTNPYLQFFIELCACESNNKI